MPPADFPVYGLDSPFPGPRWLQLFGDPPDGMPTWVALNHQSADGRSLIKVTARRQTAAYASANANRAAPGYRLSLKT
jgi:hypothetical protein